ncbi:gamma-glutamylcyclotransferase [Nocardia fusca]|uniref:allophanate hydrolase-related protein n=1 Tax=Nocardia fusca TaxID=941183 RepID=UPI00378BFB1B
MASVTMFVNGQAMSGGTLHDALHRARFLGAVDTAPGYRFYSVRDEFPGLHPVTTGGVAVPGELYEVEYDLLREELLPREPEELELGVIELADGWGSLSMRMRRSALDAPGVIDISDRGGWVAYRKEIR